MDVDKNESSQANELETNRKMMMKLCKHCNNKRWKKTNFDQQNKWITPSKNT